MSHPRQGSSRPVAASVAHVDDKPQVGGAGSCAQNARLFWIRHPQNQDPLCMPTWMAMWIG